MKILLIGLADTQPDDLFGNEGLENIRRLMEFGCFGLLKDAPSDTHSAWAALANGRAGGTNLDLSNPLWDAINQTGDPTILINVPPSSRPLSIDGVSLGQLPAPEDRRTLVTEPVAAIEEIVREVDQLALTLSEVDGRNALEVSAVQVNEVYWAVATHFLKDTLWSYLQLVDEGPGDSTTIDAASHDLATDRRLGILLELLDDDTAVVIVGHSPDGLGSYVLAAAHNPAQGENIDGHWADLAPTLLALGGREIPESMTGQSLLSGYKQNDLGSSILPEDEEAILLERLSGLGYIE